MKALRIHAGPAARRHIEQHGLRPQDIGVIPGAAGGPKGLILGPLDRFLFGDWLARSSQPVHLVGGSIGAWRMATACLADPVAAFNRLEHDYIHQHYELLPGQKRPTADFVSERFGESLQAFYGGRIERGAAPPALPPAHRHLARAPCAGARARPAHPAGLCRRLLHQRRAPQGHGRLAGAGGVFIRRARRCPLPRTTTAPARIDADRGQLHARAAGQLLHPVRAARGARHPRRAPGAYWDGGITDYHLHLDYRNAAGQGGAGLVLYPHFQQAVVPGWLDKALKWRHGATPFLDTTIVLAPDPAWVERLPNRKLPDRTDFTRYGNDLAARVKAWNAAAGAAQQLADEFGEWVERGDLGRVQPL
jgi:hypothetical protein